MQTIIRDSHKIAYPAALWITEDTPGGGELSLGEIKSAYELEQALLEIEDQGGTVGWYVSGEDANGAMVRLSTMDE